MGKCGCVYLRMAKCKVNATDTKLILQILTLTLKQPRHVHLHGTLRIYYTLPFNERANTVGNHYKLQNHSFHYDLRNHFFSACTVNIWNSLPNSVIDTCTINAFKAHLDKFWQHQIVKFDFTADLAESGNRSEKVIKWYCLFMIVYINDADSEVLRHLHP